MGTHAAGNVRRLRQKEGEGVISRFGAKYIGVLYLVLGIVGFLPIPWLNPFHAEGVGTVYLLNLIAVNTLHDIIHLIIGITGLLASREENTARLWGKFTGVVLIVLCAAGMIQAAALGFPKDQLFLGLVPLNSPGHILHLVTGALALYLGFANPAPTSPDGKERQTTP